MKVGFFEEPWTNLEKNDFIFYPSPCVVALHPEKYFLKPSALIQSSFHMYDR